jgi:hypothetical protein
MENEKNKKTTSSGIALGSQRWFREEMPKDVT